MTSRRIEDRYKEICRDAKAEGDRRKWITAAGTALIISTRKYSVKARVSWIEEALKCLSSAHPDEGEEFEKLLEYSTARVLADAIQDFEEKYCSLGEVLKELP